MTRTLHFNDICKHPIHFIACGFGTGLSPVAPGTVGTLVGVLFYIALQNLILPLYALMVVVFFIFGVWICRITEADLGLKDHPAIVWDEIVGYLITMFAAPEGWLWVLLGFGLFRVLDIFKPWPISWAERHTSAGLSVMLDDAIAGIFACIIMQWFAWFLYFD